MRSLFWGTAVSVTSRQTLLAAMRCEQPDKVPIFEVLIDDPIVLLWSNYWGRTPRCQPVLMPTSCGVKTALRP